MGLARVAVVSLRRNDAAATDHLRASLRSSSRWSSAPSHYGASGVTVLTRTGTLQRDDGPTIAYDVAGHGPLVVFVHGLASFRQTWDPVTTLLAEEFTCVRLDLRGHGASSRAAEYSMVSLVGDVRALVEEVALGEPAIVGHSLGASIAAVYAAAHGARAVVCVDESLRFGKFAGLVQAHAEDLCSQRTMEAVLSIDRALKLEPYRGSRTSSAGCWRFRARSSWESGRSC